ncbi:MAG TPA: hypothetical protein VER55_16360, partial [Ardenticatenaceae bacterium]|nr:hypothetical protein [Ardenticatenaceae bacterium]
MRSDRFDDLTRLLASGASRRQVLKGVFGAALGGFLSQAGLNFGRSEPVAAGPAQEADYQVFLPFVTSACSQASTCDNKVFCSADEQCRCIRSAEGPIRCGRPLACDVQLCTTSADCAHLGPGYFCDTPYSGCCTSPPASEARCIAPCTPPCPEDKICGADCCSAAQLCIDEACVDCPVDQQCGTTCCPEGQVCVDGTCGECPAARVCGTTCCPEGQGCLNGECVSDCDPRSITAASLGAALRQLDSGANEVSLSPQGCIQYRREYRGEMLVLEETTVNGQLLFEWRYTVGQANGWRDRDLDGFFESRTATAFDDGTGSFRTIDTEYSPETRAPVRRQTLSPAEDDGMV